MWNLVILCPLLLLSEWKKSSPKWSFPVLFLSHSLCSVIYVTLRYYTSSFLLCFWKYLHLQDLKRSFIEHLLYAGLGMQWWTRQGTSLVVWWLRLCVHRVGAQVTSLVGELKIPHAAQCVQPNWTKPPLKTVVNKTEKVLAPHVTYIFLVCKQANKEKRDHYIILWYALGKRKT